jgi:hypothetical protein
MGRRGRWNIVWDYCRPSNTVRFGGMQPIAIPQGGQVHSARRSKATRVRAVQQARRSELLRARAKKEGRE